VKTLILFRHAEAGWDGEVRSDHERPLTREGKEAALAMGRMLRLAGDVPGSAVTSSAVRARATLDLAREAGQWDCPVRVAGELYDADPGRVLEQIQAEPDGTDSLILVGHEPTWSEIVARLAGGGNVKVPAGAMVRIDLDTPSWKLTRFGGGRLIWLVPPGLRTDRKS